MYFFLPLNTNALCFISSLLCVLLPLLMLHFDITKMTVMSITEHQKTLSFCVQITKRNACGLPNIFVTDCFYLCGVDFWGSIAVCLKKICKSTRKGVVCWILLHSICPCILISNLVRLAGRWKNNATEKHGWNNLKSYFFYHPDLRSVFLFIL